MDCKASARLTATVVAPLPPFALTTEKTLPREASRPRLAAGRGKADEGLEQIGGGGGPLDDIRELRRAWR